MSLVTNSWKFQKFDFGMSDVLHFRDLSLSVSRRSFDINKHHVTVFRPRHISIVGHTTVTK